MFAGLHLENSCLLQSKPAMYGSAAHRSAHQLMTMVAKQVSKVPPAQPGKASYEDYLPLPRQMQTMILQSTDVNGALEEVRDLLLLLKHVRTPLPGQLHVADFCN